MDQLKQCLNCGFMAKAEAQFCPRCGSNQFPVPTVRCPLCGAVVPQGQYCAHCGGDLQNPSAQVWRKCLHCGNLVHITYSNCSHCGAVNLPPVQPTRVAQNQPVQKRPTKKRSGAWALAWVIPLVFLLLGIFVTVMQDLENFYPELFQPTTTQGAYHPGNTTTEGWEVPTKDVEAPMSSVVATKPVTQPATKPATQPATKPTQKPTEPPATKPATKPTDPPATKPTTKPTDPPATQPPATQPPATEPASKIPEKYQDNHYLTGVGDGYCETMTGEMLVIFLYVNDPTDGWTDAEKAEAEPALLDELRALLQEAENYGAELHIRYVFLSVDITTEFDSDWDTTEWKKEAMINAGLEAGYYNQWTMEVDFNADQVPIVFLVDEPGRSYAYTYTSGSGFENVTILEKDYSALRHEMCHVFGARDMYFPQLTTQAAKEYLPNGIMYGDCKGDIDDLTAFVIGWTDTLTPNAIAFLEATNSLTEEEIKAAKDQDTLTGYGTKYYDDGDYYTGYMVNGVRHGQGTYYFVDGSYYTGNWANGKRDGYGELYNASGFTYKGYWKDGSFHGKAVAYYSDGSVYDGYFANGDREGQGTYVYANGSKYVGTWVGGSKEGTGTMTWSDGSYYTGDWKNNTQDGYGEYYYASYGTRYVGQFVNGKRHGYGTYYYADGTVYEGLWENNVRVN